MSANSDLHARRSAAFTRGIGAMLPIYIERARNAELWDADGKRYIDFAGGIAVVNTGHVHPKVAAAVQRHRRNQLFLESADRFERHRYL